MGRVDSGLRATVHGGLRRHGFVCSTIETGSTVSGVPDTYWVHATEPCSGWIEHKATDGWAVTMRPHQLGFLRRAVRAGVRAVVCIRARGAGSGGPTRDRLWVVHGHAAETLAADGLGAVPPAAVLLTCDGGPSRWDWAAVGRALLA